MNNKFPVLLMRFTGLLFLIVFTAGSPVFSQTATLKGFVYEKESGEPAIFTNVYLKGTTIGVTTDING